MSRIRDARKSKTPHRQNFAGIIASHFGSPVTVATGGAVCLVGAGIFARRLPGLRGEARRLIIAQESLGGEPPESLTPRGIAPDAGGE